ncbi:MAG: AbrB/MazE/SpoVT family DNA-binding domain-containing protein [Acidobacteria bacterium]|nr:AbrB/MazE/SpoVT family DNA-binding domain-containing protein [Acidobacteriota bacterium]
MSNSSLIPNKEVLLRAIGEKGQVVVPKDIRDHLHLKPGSTVVFEVRGDGVILRPEKTGKEFVDQFCTTRRKLRKPVSIKQIKKTIEEQHGVR